MSKAPFYVSFNATELSILLALATPSELMLYLVLKKKASFKTACVGSFGSAINYETLAVELSRPPIQGKQAVVVDRQKARATMQALEGYGLISNLSAKAEGLTCRLPLSLIHLRGGEVKTPEVAPIQALPKMSKPSAPIKNEIPEEIFFDGDPLSILKSIDNSDNPDLSNFIQTIPSSLENQEAKGLCPSASIHPHDSLSESDGEEEEGAANTLVQRIESLLNHRSFKATSGKRSKELYLEWSMRKGFDETKLMEAVEACEAECESSDCNPINLNRFIVKACKSKLNKKTDQKLHNQASGRLIL